jgi:hypothetical protein
LPKRLYLRLNTDDFSVKLGANARKPIIIPALISITQDLALSRKSGLKALPRAKIISSFKVKSQDGPLRPAPRPQKLFGGEAELLAFLPASLARYLSAWRAGLDWFGLRLPIFPEAAEN